MDVLAGALVAIDSSGHLRGRYTVPGGVTTVVRRRTRGGLVIATGRGLIAADDELSEFEHLVDISDDPAVRTNDGGCDPYGGFVVGTMRYDETSDGGRVYRVAPDLQVKEILAPVSISNGVQWSSDGGRVFYIDTPRRRVDAFDVDPITGAWSVRRTHLRLDGSSGFPDGMAIDEEGGLWIALWGGGAVHRYDMAGRLTEVIAIPGVSQVSSCAFGGDDRSTLYITTSRKDLPEDLEPDAGAVFAVQTAVHGALLPEFAG